MPCRKLIVRPWKLAFPKGKQSPNHHFVGAMCMWNFGGCRFYDCNQEMHSVYTYIPYTPKITGHEWVVEENLCCTVLYRWSSRDVWYIFGQIQKITCCSLYSYLPPYLHMRLLLLIFVVFNLLRFVVSHSPSLRHSYSWSTKFRTTRYV